MLEAKKELVIVDRYADKITLDIISRIKVQVILITKEDGLLKELDTKKYQEQYHNLKIVYNDPFHDRYLIIDNYKIYHCGASINYAGNRTFSINLLEDEIIKKLLLQKMIEFQAKAT